jgi:hypothetical protein
MGGFPKYSQSYINHTAIMKNYCKNLLVAGSIYGQCAKSVEDHIKAEEQLTTTS